MRPPPRGRPDFDALLGAGGPLSRIPSYEVRPGQISLAKEVWGAFEEGEFLLAEAGTGTGKSLAYLLPASLSGHRVVISTGTKSLQEQLSRKDIPLLRSVLGSEIRAVVMKGRANYLCLHYYAQFAARPLLDVASEARYLKKLQRWAETTRTGDRAEWEGIPEDLALWRDINARSERCLGTHCPLYDACFVVRLRAEAEAADLVVINHHLLFADLALRNRWDASAIPPFAHLVLDEAHEAEGAAVSFFGSTVSRRMVQELCRDVQAASRGEAGGTAHDAARALAATAGAFFGGFAGPPRREALPDHPLEEGQRRLRSAMERDLARLEMALEGMAQAAPESMGLVERVAAISEGLAEVLDGEEEDRVRWVEVTGANVVLSSHPIEVGDLLAGALFGGLRTAVLTSATLAVGGDFSYLRAALGVPAGAKELVVPSPFDFDSQGLCFVPEEFPEPQSEAFGEAFLEAAGELVRLSRGRAFVLCTSHRAVVAAAAYLEPRCGFPVLVQGTEPRGLLLERFRKAGNAVLVGTASFWQGVDVQGEALSLVILDKIPFAVPSDPLTAAKIGLIRKRGADPFRSFQVPAAAILMRQGAGRLIRSMRDRGVVACTDVRLRRRGYGKTLLDAMPPFPRTADLGDVEAFFSSGEGGAGAT